tara:strand:- start:319 stop:804 length:486 start_codon:yes stop_codon:yes gene_type:complete
MAFMLGISFLSLQASSIAVESEAYTDNTVIITVDSTNLQFSPSEVTINEGQTVRFFWSGEFLDHNAVALNGMFDSGDPEKEVDYAFTFDKGTNNTYDFICEPHELLAMVGTITVNPSVDETNSTDSVNSEQDSMESTSSSLNGFLFVPAIALVILVSRYFR